MTVPSTPAPSTSSSKPTQEESNDNEHREPTKHIDIEKSTRLSLDSGAVGKENRRLRKIKKKLSARKKKTETLRDAHPVDKTHSAGFNELHLDNMRMRSDLVDLTMELGAVHHELVGLKRDFMKQEILLNMYRQMVQSPMRLQEALKKQNGELCDLMMELAETNHRLTKLQQQVSEGRLIGQPAVHTIERGSLTQPIQKKPPKTKEELEVAHAKANHTNLQLSEQNRNLAKLVTDLKTKLKEYRYLENSDYDDDDSDSSFGEFVAPLAISENSYDHPSNLRLIRPTLGTTDARANKSDECETRIAKPTKDTYFHYNKPTDETKPYIDELDDEGESFSDIEPNDENKLNEKNKGEKVKIIDKNKDHCQSVNGNMINKDDNNDHIYHIPSDITKKRGWDDGEEEKDASYRAKTGNVWNDQPMTDFHVDIDGGGHLTSAEFVRLITNEASPFPKRLVDLN